MFRVIARLDIKGSRLIKGIRYEGLRVIGDAWDFAQRYYQQGADELLYIDAVASLYGRNGLNDLLTRTVANLFVPVTAGGGIRSVEDAAALLRNGADKIAINTFAVERPPIISEIAERFGAQCVVVSIQAKKTATGWEAYTECGREHTGLDVVEWAQRVESLGAGEILLTSIDHDGTMKGGDLALVQAVAGAVNVPVIASGGIGTPDHAAAMQKAGRADALAVGAALHHARTSVWDIKQKIEQEGVVIRRSARSPAP